MLAHLFLLFLQQDLLLQGLKLISLNSCLFTSFYDSSSRIFGLLPFKTRFFIVDKFLSNFQTIVIIRKASVSHLRMLASVAFFGMNTKPGYLKGLQVLNLTIEMAEQDKQRSELLKKQLVQMGEDFEFMKKSKEEWKKQLDGRFQDIERKIEGSRQYIATEAKRTNDTLLAFQHKFEFEIKKTREDLQNNINALSKDTTDKFNQKNKEVADLNKDLAEEAKNRNNQFEEGQKDTRERIDKTNEALEKERQQRIQSEKENMGKINESLFLLKEQLKQEKDERNLKIKELEKNTTYEMASQKKFNEQFHNKTFNDFKQSLGDLRTEMEARFNSKDEIINALSKVVKTIQDTLRHPN